MLSPHPCDTISKSVETLGGGLFRVERKRVQKPMSEADSGIYLVRSSVIQPSDSGWNEDRGIHTRIAPSPSDL